MIVHIAAGSYRLKTPELLDIPNVSVNIQSQSDNTFDETPTPLTPPTTGNRVGRSPTSPQASYLTSPIQGATYNLYGQVYLVDEASGIQITPDYFIELNVTRHNSEVRVGIWNTYNLTTTLDGISLSQPESIALTGVSVGESFNPRQEKTVYLTIKETASAIIYCEITFTFSNGTSTTLTLLGKLASIVLFRPQRECVEFLSFSTDLLVSRSGLEQRRSLRKYPRHSLAITQLEPDREAANQIKNAMRGQAATLFGIPFWHMARTIMTQATAGDFVILVDTSYASFAIDDYCFLVQPGTDQFDVVRITDFDSTSITALRPIINTYTPTALLMPYYFMFGPDQFKWNEHTNHDQIDFEGRMSKPIVVPEYSFASTYEGVGVIPYKCNLYKGDFLDVSATNDYYTYDNGIGKLDKAVKWDSAKQSFAYGIHATSQEACWELRKLVYYLRGRQKTMWVPTMDDDLTPVADLSGYTLTCALNNYTKYVFDTDTNFQHLAVYEKNHSPIYTKITSSKIDTINDWQEIVTNHSFSSTAKGDVKIGFLLLCRLVSDTIEIEWISPTECYCVLRLTCVKE